MQSMQGSKAFKDMFQAMGKGAMGNGRKGKRGKKGRKGKRGKHGGGPQLDPQQLFKTMAEQMGNLPPPTAEDMAGMQKMMAQMQQSATNTTNTTNTPSTPSAPPTTTTEPAPASAPINTGELD